MKTVFVLFLALFLTTGLTSCEPEELLQTPTEQQDGFAGDPPSGEAEEELEPNG